MAPPITIKRHEAVPGTGSYEVGFADGRPSVYFYWDDLPDRRLRRKPPVETAFPDCVRA
jgi:hypothetical protein